MAHGTQVRELLHPGFPRGSTRPHVFDAGVPISPSVHVEPRDFVARADEDEPALVSGMARIARKAHRTVPPSDDQGKTDDAKIHHHDAR